MDEKLLEVKKIVGNALDNSILVKLVLSRPADKNTLKTTGRVILLGGEPRFQLETFTRDGKAYHRNLPLSEAPETVCSMLGENYRQADIITSGGDCQVMLAKSGKVTVINKIKDARTVAPEEHNRRKHHLLDENERYDFLVELGVEDEEGRVIDKKRAKFRQINRFLELLADVYDRLPREGELCVCDLCCGKSYLTFAVYYYLTKLRGRSVRMYGVDLKADVIEYCSQTSVKLGYDGMSFICGDITAFEPERPCDLVISLHACDIATDIVLAKAVKMRAGVILSTPCCHHEMMRQLDCSQLGFIEQHSILKQKLCDAATDALRALRLESEGYETTALELIDPEETPKNVMLRAVKFSEDDLQKCAQKLSEYREGCRLLGVSPSLDKMLNEIK